MGSGSRRDAQVGILRNDITGVMGHGERKGLVRSRRGAEYRVDFLPELNPETVIPDEDLAKAVQVVTRAARIDDP